MTTMSILITPTIVDLINSTWNNNLTGTATPEVASVLPRWIQILILTCMILIDISAFLGNLLVICAFFRTRRLQTVTNYFIASLAFADALVALFVLPLSIYYYQHNRSWKLGLVLCDLWVSSDVLLCTSSILNLTCISVDRYMAITRPLTYTAYRSKFLARVMILLVWIVSVVITCPPIFGWRDLNRQHTVKHEHKCDLNTARGYVVYSALGSFYIPAVVMIFVYIRIFMVVYDRDNLINKFQDKNATTSINNASHNNSSIQVPFKVNQNGLLKPKNSSNSTYDKNNDPAKPSKKSLCCCSCFQKSSPQKKPCLSHQISLPSLANTCSTVERKQNGYLVYRFTNNTNNNNNSSSNSAPNTPPTVAKATAFCRPCTVPNKRIVTLTDEMYQHRRTYLSRNGAEYQFRTGDSPCYELKTFENSLPPLTKCRSHSFDQSPTSKRRHFNRELNQQLHISATSCSTNFNERHQNEIGSTHSSDKENKKCLSNYSTKITQSFKELTNDTTRLSLIEEAKAHELNHQANRLKYSPTILTKSSSLNDQNLTTSSTYSNFNEPKPLPEQTRINRRMKPSRSTRSISSTRLNEKHKQHHRSAQHNNISIKSSQSLAFVRRKKEKENSKCSYNCCLTPLSNWYENKNRQLYNGTPQHSLTNDDDDDEKLSSNETNNRSPMIVASNTGPRTIDNSSQNMLLSSSSRYHQQSTSGNLSNPSNDVHRRERIRFMKEQKTAKTLAVVVGGFILFWLPFFIMYVIPPETYSFHNLTVTLITWLGYFNSVINPFIYAYCSKQFRMAFWNITFGMCIKKSNALLPISVKNKQIHRHHNNA